MQTDHLTFVYLLSLNEKHKNASETVNYANSGLVIFVLPKFTRKQISPKYMEVSLGHDFVVFQCTKIKGTLTLFILMNLGLHDFTIKRKFLNCNVQEILSITIFCNQKS